MGYDTDLKGLTGLTILKAEKTCNQSALSVGKIKFYLSDKTLFEIVCHSDAGCLECDPYGMTKAYLSIRHKSEAHMARDKILRDEWVEACKLKHEEGANEDKEKGGDNQ